MLKINADERITAANVLAHPFIHSSEVDCRPEDHTPSSEVPPGTEVVQSTTSEQEVGEEQEQEEVEPEG